MSDLQEAIDYLKRVTPANSPWTKSDFTYGPAIVNVVDQHIATLLNAVVSGDLIPAKVEVGDSPTVTVHTDKSKYTLIMRGEPTCVYYFDDISDSILVDVKPLVWEYFSGDGHLIARTKSSGGDQYSVWSDFSWDALNTGGLGYSASVAAAKAAAEAHNRAHVLSQITTRSVDEVLEQAADACADYPRAAPSEDEWTRYDEQIEHSQQCIRALKSQPTPAPARDEAVQQVVQALSDAILWLEDSPKASVRTIIERGYAALAAMEGR